jgi:plasmid maintenance system antidote protein VapI
MEVPSKKHQLLDKIMKEYKLKTDAELARFLELKASQISKLRHNRLPVGAETILRVHDITGWEIKTIKGLLP